MRNFSKLAAGAVLLCATATTLPAAAAGTSHTSTGAKIETLEDYFKLHERRGAPESTSIAGEVRLAAVTSLPGIGSRGQIASDTVPPLIYVAENGSSPKLSDVPREQIDKALADLLAERESWGTEPSVRSSEAAGETNAAAASAESEPVELEAYLDRRESWGVGAPPKEVKAPLAAGAVTPLPSAAAAPAAAEGEAPIIHPREEVPPPELTEIPQGEIESALKKLLAERESWGTEPSAEVAAAPEEADAAAAEEQSAPAEAAEAKPAPAMAEVPRADVDKALSELLSERESWGTKPSASGTQVAARPADATTCEASLREVAGKGTILFKLGSAVLDAGSYPTLDELAKLAKGCQNASIYVEGHTDNIGPDNMNQALSEQRAMAVLKYLVQGGVNSSRIEAVGYGKSRPLVPNTNAENRAKNRRIEFKVR